MDVPSKRSWRLRHVRNLSRLLFGFACFTLTNSHAETDGQPGRGDRLSGRNFAGRSEVIAQYGVAATSQPLATQVAVEILKNNGSAVDAAIGANAALGLMEPTGCGA
jgi:gamma-glutamyltranspeptidase/glutathione hydrolase